MYDEITWADVDCDHPNRRDVTDCGYVIGGYCPDCKRRWNDDDEEE